MFIRWLVLKACLFRIFPGFEFGARFFPLTQSYQVPVSKNIYVVKCGQFLDSLRGFCNKINERYNGVLLFPIGEEEK